MLKKKIQPFNDGLIQPLVYEKSTIKANDGEPIQYALAVAGYKRRYMAETAGHLISKVINVPLDPDLAVGDLLEIRDYRSGVTEILKVTQVYQKTDSLPPVLQVTLEKGSKAYADQREAGQSLSEL